MANTENLPDYFHLILDHGLNLTIEASGPLVLTLIIIVALATASQETVLICCRVNEEVYA